MFRPPPSALLRDPEVPWDAIPDLPKAAAAILQASFAHATSRVLRLQRSACGDTTKLLVQLQDGMQVRGCGAHAEVKVGGGG